MRHLTIADDDDSSFHSTYHTGVFRRYVTICRLLVDRCRVGGGSPAGERRQIAIDRSQSGRPTHNMLVSIVFFAHSARAAAVYNIEESISDSVSADLGIDHSGAIGNNDLVVAVQR